MADPGPDGGCGDYADCNGNGAFDLGEPCFEQPPFDDVDANGDGKIDREEARAFWGDDPNFDQSFDNVDKDGSGDVDQEEFDSAGNDEGQDHEGQDHEGQDHEGQDHEGQDHEGPAMSNCEALDRGLDTFMNQDGDEMMAYSENADGTPACGDMGDHQGGDHGGDMGDHQGGDHGDMTPLDHRIEGINMFLNDMANNGVLASEDIDFLVNEAKRLEEAVHSEWDGNDGAVGVVMGEIEAWLNDNVEDPGVRDHYMHELCMLEYEAHKEHKEPGTEDGGPDCGGPMNHSGPDGPSQAVMEAWGSGQQSDGYFDFDAAFDAAEATAKEEALAEGTYTGDEAWGECVEVGRNAMNAARDDDKSPMDVFQAVAQAVNECGQAQANQN